MKPRLLLPLQDNQPSNYKMRMHSYGKCSPNLTVGAITIFSLIVLYSYWNLSTYNRDLLLKLHTAEEQAIQLDKNNEALQATYDKTVAEKSKLEFSLMEEQVAEKDVRKRVAEREQQIKSLKDQLENGQKDSLQLAEELKNVEAQLDSKDKEAAELKSRVVTLEAQLQEEKTQRDKLNKSLQEATSKKESPSVAHQDTVVPKPEESQLPSFVADPVPGGAEQQMNPVPSSNNAKEENVGEIGVGVLPIPGSNGDVGDDGGAHAGENLDFAEDDLKAAPADNQKEEDDPADGTLNAHEQKESNLVGVGPAPPHGNDVIPHQSGQEDNREAAHLQPQLQDPHAL